jgi:putative Ig domain-containing protein
MKKLLLFLISALGLSAQTVTWTQQTGPATNPPYSVDWVGLTKNLTDHTTLMMNDDVTNTIFQNSLYSFSITNPASATGLSLQKLGSSGSHAGIAQCPFARADWPGDTQFNHVLIWDSKRNKMVMAFGVANLCNPDPSDRFPYMWEYIPSQTAPPQTMGEHFHYLNPATTNLPTQQYYSSGAHDPVHDLYFVYGYDNNIASSLATKIFCPTDLNPIPGTPTSAQTAAGCGTTTDGWLVPSGLQCKATPSSSAVTCTDLLIPPIDLVPYVAWDATAGVFVLVGESNNNGNIGSVQTWTYAPSTKTFTNVTSLSTPPPLWMTGQDGATPMAYNPNDGNHYFHQKAGFTLSVTNPGSGYTNGSYQLSWASSSCSTEPAAHYTVSGGVITAAAQTAADYQHLPSVDCINLAAAATQTNGGGTGGVVTVTWTPQADWTLTPSTWVWTNLGAFTGPPTVEAMEIDPAWNTIIAWCYHNNSSADVWLGQISGTYVPTITTVGLPGGTNGVAYSQTLTAATTNGTVTWTQSGLPAWASLNASTGAITGTPNATGTTSFTVTATNSSGSSNKTLFITVAAATLSVPLTIQEALYPGGTTGVARTNETFCGPDATGVPIPDSAQIDAGKWNTLGLSGSDAGLTTLGLTGTGVTAGQFRVLAVWPDGYAKWIEVCGTLSSFSAGGTATVTLTNTGSGNFGGSNLASTTDASNTIVVQTGTGTCGVTSTAICFTLKKTGHNGIDEVQIGTTTVLNTGSGQLGYVVNGPDYSQTYPTNVQCVSGTSCLGGDLYNSSVDDASQCVIEKNGPVQAVVRCNVTHFLLSGSTHWPYMRTIVRYYFNKGSAAVKATDILANEDVIISTPASGDGTPQGYGATLTNTFGTAWKNFQAYELRLKPNISGTLTYNFGTASSDACSGDCTGSLTGTASAYLYQGLSTFMQDQNGAGDCTSGVGCIPQTADTGYTVVANGSTVVSPTAASVVPQGWADISNSSGVGVEIGAYQLGTRGPISLEFQNGGADVRFGIFSQQNSQTAYLAWPNQITRDIWMEFHTSTPSSYANEFLKFQHPLIGRAAYTWYNSTGVFPYQLTSSATEDAYYNAIQAASISPPAGSATISSVTTANPVQITLPSSVWVLGLKQYQELNISGASGCNNLNSTVNIWSGAGTTTLTVQYANTTQGSPSSSYMDTSACGSYVANSATITPASPISSGAACCIQDLGTSNAAWPLFVYNYWYWHKSGGPNQNEFRFSDLMAFITRGYTGRYVNAHNWYYYAADAAWPRSLGFDWRGTRTVGSSQLDGFGFPSNYTQQGKAACSSGPCASQQWMSSDSGEHAHWYGMPYYYLMTGDETIKDALLDGPKDWYLTTTPWIPNQTLTYQAGAGLNFLGNAREIGTNLNGAAELSSFLSSINDPDSLGVLNLGIADFENQVNKQLCASGYPSGCTLYPGIDLWPTGATAAEWYANSAHTIPQQGINPARGVFQTANSNTASSTWCGVNHTLRADELFLTEIGVQGLLRLRTAAGPTWGDYWNALDIADGIAHMHSTELYYDDGSGRWDVTGFRYEEATDWENNCTNSGEYPRQEFAPQTVNDAGPLFLARNAAEGGITNLKPLFNNYLARNMSSGGFNNSSPGADLETLLPQAVISAINGTQQTLQTLTCSFTSLGGGSYTLSNCPGVASASYYRVKFSTTNPIVDWIGYDAGSATFTGSPSSSTAWFAATNASASNSTGIPTPSGSPWSITVNTGQTGLTAANFRVSAMAPPATCTISITAPTSAQSITTTAQARDFTFTVSLTACPSANSVGWFVDSDPQPLGMAYSATNFSLPYNMFNDGNGSHSVTATAYDANNVELATSAAVTYTLANTGTYSNGAATYNANVTVTPSCTSACSGNITFTVVPSGTYSAFVAYSTNVFVDGQNVISDGACGSSPCSGTETLDTRNYYDGSHLIRIEGAQGVNGESHVFGWQQTITFANGSTVAVLTKASDREIFLQPAGTYTLTGTTYNADGSTVASPNYQFLSLNTAVATVNQTTGLVTAVGAAPNSVQIGIMPSSTTGTNLHITSIGTDGVANVLGSFIPSNGGDVIQVTSVGSGGCVLGLYQITSAGTGSASIFPAPGTAGTTGCVFTTGPTRYVWAYIHASNAVPHLSRGGGILTSYSSSASFWHTSMFFKAQTFNTYANWCMDYNSAGYNTLEVELEWEQPGSVGQSAWTTGQTAYTAAQQATAQACNTYLHGIMDSWWGGDPSMYPTSRGPSVQGAAAWATPPLTVLMNTLASANACTPTATNKCYGSYVYTSRKDEFSTGWCANGCNVYQPNPITWGNGLVSPIVCTGTKCTVNWPNWSLSSLSLIVSGATNTALNSPCPSPGPYAATSIDSSHFSFPNTIAAGNYTSTTDPSLTIEPLAYACHTPPGGGSATDYVRYNAFAQVMNQMTGSGVTGNRPIGTWTNPALTSAADTLNVGGNPNMADNTDQYMNENSTIVPMYRPSSHALFTLINDMGDNPAGATYRTWTSSFQDGKPFLMPNAPGISAYYTFAGYPCTVTSFTGNTITCSADHGIRNVLPNTTRVALSSMSTSGDNGNYKIIAAPTANTLTVYTGTTIVSTATTHGTILFQNGDSYTSLVIQNLSNPNSQLWGLNDSGNGCVIATHRGMTFTISGTGTAWDSSGTYFYPIANVSDSPCTNNLTGAFFQIPAGTSTSGTATITPDNWSHRGLSNTGSSPGPLYHYVSHVYPAIIGAAGIRTYPVVGYDPQFFNWSSTAAASGVPAFAFSTDASGNNGKYNDWTDFNSNAEQFGPYTGSIGNGVIGEWVQDWWSIGLANLQNNAKAKWLFKPHLNSPDIGIGFECAARGDSGGNLVVCQSFWNNTMTMTIPTSAYLQSGQAFIKDHCTYLDCSTVSVASGTTSISETCEPGCTVWLRFPTVASAEWTAPTISANLSDVPNATSITVVYSYTPFPMNSPTGQGLLNSVNCGTGTACALPVDKALGITYYQILYLNSAGTVIARSGIQTL